MAIIKICLLLFAAEASAGGSKSSRYVMGLDGGTESVRCGVFRSDGTCVATAAAEYPTSFPKAGWAEQNPDDWWNCLAKAVREALELSSKEGVTGADIAGLCMDTTSCTVVALDKGGPAFYHFSRHVRFARKLSSDRR